MFSIEYFANSLAQRMREKGWSGRQLALRAGIKPSVVRDILNGKSKDPGISKIAALAEALDCNVDTLISGAVPKTVGLDQGKLTSVIKALDVVPSSRDLQLEQWCRCVAELYAVVNGKPLSPELVIATMERVRNS